MKEKITILVIVMSVSYIGMFVLVGWKIGFGILLGLFASNIEKEINTIIK